MVLIRAVAVLVLVTGCKQSLFDNNAGDDDPTGDGGTNGDGMVASSCPATCLADAAADFGMTKWRYLEDTRNRMWTAMMAASGAYVGTRDPANKIDSCTSDASAPACTALPGGLVVSTAGSTSTADPALSYTATTKQVIQLSVRVHVPSSAAAHDIWLYRNSREDSLFKAPAAPGATFERAITVDAIDGDRFYLALQPTAGGAKLGVHMFINATTDTFPLACQLALPFSAAAGNTVDNVCGVDYTFYDYGTTAQPPVLAAGPFPELGMAAEFVENKYFKGEDVIVRAGDTTTQLWLRHDAFIPGYNAWPFSDLDLDDFSKGGVGIYLVNQAPPKLGADTCTNGTTLEFVGASAVYPDDHAWHFVRVVHTNGMVKICVDGTRTASYALPAGDMQSKYPPYLGRNAVWTPSGGFLDGAIDDVRVFTTALPCE